MPMAPRLENGIESLPFKVTVTRRKAG